MHKVKIRQEVIDRVTQRRGGRHILHSLAARRTALLVIDMQNHFVSPRSPFCVASAAAIVPNINRLAGAVRLAGGRVVWIRNIYSKDNLQDWSVFFEGFYTAQKRALVIAGLARDSQGAELWPELEVLAEDWQAEKDRHSAFIHDDSDLEVRLRAAGIDTLAITGTLMPVCCEATARDAMMRNFKVVVAADGNAAHSDADYNASLSAILQVSGDVMTVDEIVARLSP